MTSSADLSPLRGRAQFVLLGILFGAPLLAAMLLYFLFPGSRPQTTTNYGELIVPARPLPELELIETDGDTAGAEVLKRRWTLLVRAGSDCDRACLDALVLTRQTRLALNEKRSRVQRVLLLDDADALASIGKNLLVEHPDLQVLAAGNGAAARFFDGSQAIVHVLDPLGNWLMRYPPGRAAQDDFKGLQKDIKRLLRVSQIG